MFHFLIGHRGVGKTALLQRLQIYFLTSSGKCLFFDLDKEIEKRTNKSIAQIFLQDGERVFRRLELQCLEQIVAEVQPKVSYADDESIDQQQKTSELQVFIALGAGFQLESIEPLFQKYSQSQTHLQTQSSSYPQHIKQFQFVWVQRDSDILPRFSVSAGQEGSEYQRPRLLSHLSPRDEFAELFPVRHERYKKYADEYYLMPEGLSHLHRTEALLLTQIFSPYLQIKPQQQLFSDVSITLPAHVFFNADRIKSYILNRSNWGLLYFEWRSDIAPLDIRIVTEVLQILAQQQSKTQLLISFRPTSAQLDDSKNYRDKNNVSDISHFILHLSSSLKPYLALDWALELGGLETWENYFPRPVLPDILSMHRHPVDYMRSSGVGASAIASVRLGVKESLQYLYTEGTRFRDWSQGCCNLPHLKAALTVQNFSELYHLDEWWSQNPNDRSVLPISPDSDARWLWYRLRQKGQQRLRFVREFMPNPNPAITSSVVSDQPSLFDELKTEDKPKKFAAVLGDPVRLSWTPLEQENFFNKTFQSPVWPIRVTTQDWQQCQALKKLQDWGLCAAAVTSPLKQYAVEFRPTSRAQSLGSANTLWWNEKEKHWCSENTDLEGFAAWLYAQNKPLPLPIAVWGGGGVLSVIRQVLQDKKSPFAPASVLYFSAQFANCRDQDLSRDEISNFLPQTVLLASSFACRSQLKIPSEWSPRLILDLSYSPSSVGREYAVEVKAEYQSGAQMFKAQAVAQRRFWLEKEEEHNGR